MFAATTSETRIGVVLNGFDAKLQALVNAVDIGRHGKEHRVLPVATLLDSVEVPQLSVCCYNLSQWKGDFVLRRKFLLLNLEISWKSCIFASEKQKSNWFITWYN